MRKMLLLFMVQLVISCSLSNNNTAKMDVNLETLTSYKKENEVNWVTSNIDTSRLPPLEFYSQEFNLEISKYWCSNNILAQTANSVEELSIEQLALFLATFSKFCETNSEYLEHSNQLLFKTCASQPELLIKTLSVCKSINLTEITKAFETPIDDTYDIKKLIQNIEQINTKDQTSVENIKKEIVESLKISLLKYE